MTSLYHRYNDHGAGAIPFADNFDDRKFDVSTKELLDEVVDEYGQ